MSVLLLAIGGAAGAICRYHLERFVQARTRRAFPLGIWLINLSGSLLLGLLGGLLLHHAEWPGEALRLLLGVGFCGAYTTFSSFALEISQLWRIGQRRAALLDLLSQPLLGGLAAWIGLWLGSRL
jgi:CrcB protein